MVSLSNHEPLTKCLFFGDMVSRICPAFLLLSRNSCGLALFAPHCKRFVAIIFVRVELVTSHDYLLNLPATNLV
jgi:hypothetical protein